MDGIEGGVMGAIPKGAETLGTAAGVGFMPEAGAPEPAAGAAVVAGAAVELPKILDIRVLNNFMC